MEAIGKNEERQERIPPCVPNEEIKKQSKWMTLSVLSDGVKKLHRMSSERVQRSAMWSVAILTIFVSVE